MRNFSLFAFLILSVFATAVVGQKTVLIYDPLWPSTDGFPTLSEEMQAEFDRAVRPKLEAKYTRDGCSVDPDLSGEVTGSFTRRGADQRAAFFQVCQTGNGFGIVAVVIFENEKAIGIWVGENGWSMDIRAVKDINRNGLDEFTLSYGGGMHQGMSATGVDLVEFRDTRLVGLGWFQAERSVDSETEEAWKITARPGTKPVFYRQRYRSDRSGQLVKTGANAAFTLKKTTSGFTKIG